MNAENFAYWLQGFFELAGTDKLTAEQVKMVKDHLALVFTKVTPDRRVKTKKKDRKAKKVEMFDLKKWLEEPTQDRFRDPIVTCSVEGASALGDLDKEFCSALTEAAKVNAPIDREKVNAAMAEAREKAEQAAKDLQAKLSPTRWVGGGRAQRYC